MKAEMTIELLIEDIRFSLCDDNDCEITVDSKRNIIRIKCKKTDKRFVVHVSEEYQYDPDQQDVTDKTEGLSWDTPGFDAP